MKNKIVSLILAVLLVLNEIPFQVIRADDDVVDKEEPIVETVEREEDPDPPETVEDTDESHVTYYEGDELSALSIQGPAADNIKEAAGLIHDHTDL